VLLFKEEILNNNSTRNLLHHIPAHLPVKQVDFIENLFNKLSTLNADIDIVASYINVIIHHILQETTVEAEKIDNVLFEYQKLVDDNFINLKRVTDYADKLNVSPNKLNELSKKMLGRTAHDIIKERLFIEAKVLLTHTQKTINEIALDLKFSDAPHFNKFFRACAKLTPGQYRKMLKGKNVQQNQ
jgi:AraC-like DNA-binding protein